MALAATEDKRWFPDVREALQEASTPFGESQIALALGLIGHADADGAKLVEEFLHAHYGRQGCPSGQQAFVILAGHGADALEAVSRRPSV